MSITRNETDIIGSVATPASLPAGSNTTGNVDLSVPAGVFDSALTVNVIVGTAPSASPTVAFFYSLDGINYVQDGGTISVPTTASTATPVGPYIPPAAAKKALAKITNNDTGAVAITVWAQGSTLASSNL